MVEQRDNSIEDVKAESATSYQATAAVEPEFPTSYAGTLARMRGKGQAADGAQITGIVMLGILLLGGTGSLLDLLLLGLQRLFVPWAGKE